MAMPAPLPIDDIDDIDEIGTTDTTHADVAELGTAEPDAPESIGKPAARRTQAERRAATQAALLDATITALCEHGYARLTTTQIVTAAGVTRGAQAHYYSNKAELVVEAVEHVTRKLTTDLRARPVRGQLTARGEFAVMIDRFWQIRSEPVFQATMEILVAARTDEELRSHLGPFERVILHSASTWTERLPLLSQREDFPELVTVAFATISGLALFACSSSPRQVNRLWVGARARLLDLVPGEDVGAPDDLV